MRIVICEDNALLRDGLTRLLRDAGETVVAAVADGDALLLAVARHQPDLVIVDVRMPPSFTDEGAQAARLIRRRFPRVGVLVLSHDVEVGPVVALAGRRAFGYLLKDSVLDVQRFVESARNVAAGGSVLDPDVVQAVTDFASRRQPEAVAQLSRRERSVLALIAEGRSNRSIARALSLTERTIESHVSKLMVKLNLPQGPDHHRRVLAALAYRG